MTKMDSWTIIIIILGDKWKLDFLRNEVSSHEGFIVVSNLLHVNVVFGIDVGFGGAIWRCHSRQWCEILKLLTVLRSCFADPTVSVTELHHDRITRSVHLEKIVDKAESVSETTKRLIGEAAVRNLVVTFFNYLLLCLFLFSIFILLISNRLTVSEIWADASYSSTCFFVGFYI